jgi:hypothetical protein
MGKPPNIIGARFGQLVVLRRAGKTPDRGRTLWLCQCDCGKRTVVRDDSLKYSKGSRSCGCRKNIYRHGYARRNEKDPLYWIWSNMHQRCSNPNATKFARYGARGIKVCKRWNDFVNFQADVGDRPHPSLSIGRIDNDGPYTPDNVEWQTRSKQARNQLRGPRGKRKPRRKRHT